MSSYVVFSAVGKFLPPPARKYMRYVTVILVGLLVVHKDHTTYKPLSPDPMTTSHDGDLSSSKGGYDANTTDVSVPNNKLIVQVPEPPSSPTQAPGPDPTTQTLSNLEPISYFRYHREDRLMGVLAGLRPLTTTTTTTTTRHQALSNSIDPTTSSADEAPRSHTEAPLVTHSTGDISVFGTGAWIEGGNTNLRCP
ncbi:hypothetical protein F5X97DRAFT_342352 [Nemania serpens]|nr:hypothetical protein F5X97DRAFT_342352 [Nemania serpens]